MAAKIRLAGSVSRVKFKKIGAVLTLFALRVLTWWLFPSVRSSLLTVPTVKEASDGQSEAQNMAVLPKNKDDSNH